MISLARLDTLYKQGIVPLNAPQLTPHSFKQSRPDRNQTSLYLLDPQNDLNHDFYISDFVSLSALPSSLHCEAYHNNDQDRSPYGDCTASRAGAF